MKWDKIIKSVKIKKPFANISDFMIITKIRTLKYNVDYIKQQSHTDYEKLHHSCSLTGLH